MDDIEQVVVVEGVDFYEQVKISRGVVTFHHLGYLLQLLHHNIKVFRILEVKAYIGTRLIADFLWVNDEL